MKRFVKVIFGLIATLIALPMILSVVWLGWAHFVQSPQYAANYFDGVLNVDEVVESRRWIWGRHPWAGRGFGCTYAIVNIPESASPMPPESWSANWKTTPVETSEGRHALIFGPMNSMRGYGELATNLVLTFRLRLRFCCFMRPKKGLLREYVLVTSAIDKD